MKKIILAILPFLVFGCEEIPTGEVSQKENSFQIISITAPDSFIYRENNTSFTTNLEFNYVEDIKEVYFNLYSSSGKKLNSSPVIMKDDGDLASGDFTANDKKYTSVFKFGEGNPNGKYEIEYFVTDKSDNSRSSALHFFKFENFINYPPVISDLVMPDTIAVDVLFTFTIKASDQNGLDDIKAVFFKFIGATGEVSGQMQDDGGSISGDVVASDGVYSFTNKFNQDAKNQDRIFTFQAQDRGDSLSNTITHKIYIK